MISTNRIQSIDSLRAIAALIVVYAHTWAVIIGTDGYTGAGFFNFLNDAVFQRGQLGVMLFFIISGYVIPRSLIAHRSGNLCKFALSRFARLYPAYWLSLGAFILLSNHKVDGRTLLFNLTMIQHAFSVPDLVGVYWTLFIEIIFYTIMAGLFAIGWLESGQKSERLLVGFVMLTVIATAVRRTMDLPLPAGTMMLLCLMFLGTWLRLGSYDLRKLLVMASAFLFVMLVCAFLLYYPDRYGAPWYLQYGRYVFSVALFLLGIKALNFSARWLAYLGLISYSIYLFHQPIVAFVIRHMDPPTDLLSRFFMLGIALSITFIVAALVFHIVERPCIELGRKLGMRVAANIGKAGRSV